jgi:hypothetical protein
MDIDDAFVCDQRLLLVQIGSEPIDFFYKNVIESSSDKESDGETELLLAAASMAHDHFMLPKHRGGSSVKRKANKNRDRVGGHASLMRDYFHHTNPIYDAKTFRRRYRMSKKFCFWIFFMA